MKVLQATAALEQGGVERGTLEMARFIIARGAVSLVASQGGRLIDQLEREGSRHVKLPLAKRNPAAIIYSALQISHLIRKEGVDLVHARSRAPAWASLLACRMTGCPMVTTFHGTHRIQNRFKNFYNSSMVRGKRVIAISNFIKQHIMENYGVAEDRIDVAPRGFDPAIFDPQKIDPERIEKLRRNLGIPIGTLVIALPGRLTRWKGQGLFLRALGQIVDLPWHALLIGGTGRKSGYLQELQELAEDLGIAHRVIYAGDQADIMPWYALCDLVVSASTEPEAFGRVAVEAQVMGRPVIASAHGGSLETVLDGETGWLFHNSDAIDLAAKLRFALSPDTDLVHLGKQAHCWVAENFTIDQMCRAEWASYKKVFGNMKTVDNGLMCDDFQQ